MKPLPLKKGRKGWRCCESNTGYIGIVISTTISTVVSWLQHSILEKDTTYVLTTILQHQTFRLS